jgi:uncharacterized membrane protein
MHPVVRVILVVVGAALGASLAAGPDLLPAIVGALAGLAIGEALYTRDTIAELRSELRDLHESRVQPAPPAARTVAAAPAAPVTPVTPVTPPPAGQSAAESTVRTPASEAARPQAGDGVRVEARPLAPADFPRWDSPRPARHAAEIPIITLLWRYFTGGNALVRGGVIVLFFGVAFLLRYLAEHSHIPMALRLSGVAFGALILLVFGWRLRTKRRGYALALQGGAVGILYLTVFSALHLYSLLSPVTAFALLAAISALTAMLAVSQSSLAAALLSVTGGFLAPFLASGHGGHVALFSYFMLLNIAILGIAWFRSWRLLNVAGFAFTFVLSVFWGVLQYRPQDFATSEPFLAAFFLLYVGIAVLYSTRQASESTGRGYIDATIVFGTPLAAFGLQAGMLHGHRLELGGSSLAVGALYGALAAALHRRQGDRVRLLAEAFMALGIAFLTLAVPLALNARWSAASWALEGAALIWVGCRQNRRAPRAFGALLQLAAGAALALTLTTERPVPAGIYLAALMVGMASAYGAQILHASEARLQDYEVGFSVPLFLWGLFWWCLGGIGELRQDLTPEHWLAAHLSFATATALLGAALAERTRMRISLVPAFALLPLMLLCALWAAATLQHPLAQGGWIAWPFAFIGLYYTLRQHDRALDTSTIDLLHTAGFWLLTALLSWELSWDISRTIGVGAWSILPWAIVPALALTILPAAAHRARWPFREHRGSYSALIPAGLVLALAGWSIYADAAVSSPSAPLPYLPLANPLDLAQALVLTALIRDWRRLRSEQPSTSPAVDSRVMVIGLAFVGFLWLSAALLRTLHLWIGIPYALQALMRSTLAQSALSIFWALLALAAMLLGTRYRARLAWLMGATLLVLVVIKLFLVDLASVGTIERIVSFVGVGLLMLVIGYFSPLPPAADRSR